MKELSLVLLPTRSEDLDYLVELSVKTNRSAANKNLLLNRKNRLPHLTLAMLFADPSDMLTESIYAESIELVLEPKTVTYSPSADTCIQWAVPDKMTTLQSLHRKAMEVRSRYHTPHKATKKKCRWVDRFVEHSGSQYRPHFTIGISEREVSTDQRTIPCRVALAVLGVRCTVQKVLK